MGDPRLAAFRLTAKLAKARALARSGEFGRAAEGYAALVRARPDDPRLWMQYGHALKEAGRPAEAEAAYGEAVALAPHASDGYRHLAHLIKARDRASAKALFLKGAAVAPDDADLRAEAVALGSDSGRLATELLVAALSVGSPSRHERSHGTDLVGEARSALHLFLARRAARRRIWPGAVRHYGMLVTLRPASADLRVQLGHALREAGDRAGALACYRLAAAWDPRLPEAHRQIGYALHEAGDRAGARHAFLTAYRLQPSFDDVARELARYGLPPAALGAVVEASWDGEPAGRSAERRGGERQPLAGRAPSGLTRREGRIWGELSARLARR